MLCNEFLFNIQFNNSIIRVDELLEQQDGLYADFFENQCETCIRGDRESILFIDPGEQDYHLDSLSIAEEQAIPLPNISIDLEGNPRDPNTPDIGCYERLN